MLPIRDRRSLQAGMIVLALCVLNLGACSRSEAPIGSQTSLAAPGQWLLVNYWAEWCRPCIEEIPELAAFAAANTERARVLLVNFDDVKEPELSAQATRLGIPIALLLEHDPARELGLERPQVLPSTFVIAPDGTLRATLRGAQTAAKLTAAIGGS